MKNPKENVFDVYVKELCRFCINKNKNICEIKQINKETYKCENYER